MSDTQDIPPRIFQDSDHTFYVGLYADDIPDAGAQWTMQFGIEGMKMIALGQGDDFDLLIAAETIIRDQMDHEVIDWLRDNVTKPFDPDPITLEVGGKMLLGYQITFREPKDAVMFKLRYSQSITRVLPDAAGKP